MFFFKILTLSCLNPSHHDAKSLNGSSQPLLYQSPSSFFQFTSSLLPVSSSLLPVYFQFSSRLQPTSKSTFLCQIFSFYEVWANNDGFGQYIPFWLIRLKPYCLQDRKMLIDIIDYPLCTVEKTKKWSNKLKQRVWTTSKFGWTTFVPVSSSLLPVYFQFVPVYFQSTSSLLPVYFQFSSRLQPTSKSTFLCQIFDFLWNYYKLIRYTVWANNDIIDYPLCSVEKTKNDQKNWNKECELPQNLIEW